MITVQQFDGQYTEADMATISAAAREAVQYYDLDRADISRAERAEIESDIEDNASGRYDENLGIVNASARDLLSEPWQRLLAARGTIAP